MDKNRAMYRTMQDDPFPEGMEISFTGNGERQTLYYEKVSWAIDGEERGLRYGENPDQAAALYRPVNGNLSVGKVRTVSQGRFLVGDAQLLQSGKHPGKINLTDVDAALNILKYLHGSPAAAIMKHNNPSGVAIAASLSQAYSNAYFADRLAAFGGAVALNRSVDRETAAMISESYLEVLAAPDFEDGVLDLLQSKKNLRIMKISDIEELSSYQSPGFIDFQSLIDGSIIVQEPYVAKILADDDLVAARTNYKGEEFRIKREPTLREKQDMRFGWLVEAGITSNSVIYVKNGVTVGIGTGEQDRVGVAEIARDKAYRKYSDKLAWELFNRPFNQLESAAQRDQVTEQTRDSRGGLSESVMISDGFFPFRDGVDVGIREGVSAILQPGGSIRDWESIQACNEAGVSMSFTGQRSFRH